MEETRAIEKVRHEVVAAMGEAVLACLAEFCAADPSITASEIASTTASVYLTTMLRCIEIVKQVSPAAEAEVRGCCLESITRLCQRITDVVN